MNDILFIADFFPDQVAGGGELNNQVLIEDLIHDGYKVCCKKSHEVKACDILNSSNVIVANFINFHPQLRTLLRAKPYVIYEHDHKYLSSRNPAFYRNYKAPKEKIINREFYSEARAVLCQSQFHANIAISNLELPNIKSLGGNLWSDSHLSLLEEVCSSSKKKIHAIMESSNWHKGTQEALMYCQTLGLEHALIKPQRPSEFLRDLGQYDTLVFFPKTPETLSRIVVEARMMGMSTKTTKNIGAIHEPWFRKKGLDLIEAMRYKRQEIKNIILSVLGG
jgi:hypothetical protein